MKPLIHLLWPFYRRYWLLGVIGIFCVALVNILALYPAWVTGQVIDVLTQAERAPSLWEGLKPILAYIGGLFVLAGLRSFFMVAMRLTLVVLSRRVERDHRSLLLDKLLQWDLSTLNRHPLGELMTYFTEDLNRLRNFTGPVILYGLQVLFLIAFTGALMLYTDPELAAMSLLPLLLAGPFSYFLRRQALERGHKQQEAFAALSAFLQQVYPFLRPLRAMADPFALSRQWEKRIQHHRETSLAVARVEAYLQPLTVFFVGFSLTIVLIYGGIQVAKGQITLGVVGSFSLYLLQLLFPLGALGWLMSLIQQARASAERLLRLQAIQPVLSYPTRSRKEPAHAGWRWEKLSFRYEETSPWVIEKASGFIAPGEKVVFSLPMGCGKTTFARLLVRQLDPVEGQICFGEVPICHLSRAVLRQHIGYVPQQPLLLSGTIVEHLRLVEPSASLKELWRALEWAGLAEEVSALPHGLHTEIGVWGQQVSGGQRQRLALAMTLLRRPKALILDETFAPLDSEKIREILSHLQKHFGSATWVFFTHREEVLPFIDRKEESFASYSFSSRKSGARCS